MVCAGRMEWISDRAVDEFWESSFGECRGSARMEINDCRRRRHRLWRFSCLNVMRTVTNG